MDEQTPTNTPPPPPQEHTTPPIYIQMPAQKETPSTLKRLLGVVVWIVLILSVMLNAILLSIVDEKFLAERPAMVSMVLVPGKSDQIIAVYHINGIINAETVSKFGQFCDQVEEDDNVRAVVLRISSPGGGVASSERMHHLVTQLRSTGKKVVVSMGSAATSGAYMAACPADEILAEPSTITGSIGVIATWLVLDETMNKLGIEPIVIKAKDSEYWKDDISPWHVPDERQAAYIRGMLDQMQDRFEQAVREGRGEERLRPREVTRTETTSEGESVRQVTVTETEPFNAKAYLADDAMELGLIDRIGYQEDAFDRAAELAGLDKPHVVEYRHRQPGLLTMLFGETYPAPLQLDAETLNDLQQIRFMAIWRMD